MTIVYVCSKCNGYVDPSKCTCCPTCDNNKNVLLWSLQCYLNLVLIVILVLK